MSKEEEDLSNVRASFARLETRARQLLRHSDFRVLRTPRSVYQATKSCVEEFKQASSNAPVEQHRGEPVELFLSNLGFSIQEHTQQLRQAAMKRDPDLVFTSLDGSGGFTSSDLDEFLASRRNELLKRVSDSAHKQIAAKISEYAEQHLRTVQDRRNKDLAEIYEVKALHPGGLRSSTRPSDGSGAFGNGGSAGGIKLSQAEKIKMESFARSVALRPPSQWMQSFALHIQQSFNPLDAQSAASCELWCQVARILDNPATASGSSGGGSHFLNFAGASRVELERSFLLDIFESCSVRVTAANMTELQKTDAATVRRYLSQMFPDHSSKWIHIFFAMRAGRYDAAQNIASHQGFDAVANALAKIAATPSAGRCKLPPAHALESSYVDPATRDDPYRCAVLLILLSGSVGDSRVLKSIVERIMTSIEDILWFRLALVREVDGVGRVNCLRELQNQVKNDRAQLSATLGSGQQAGTEIVKLASLFIHVLLPSSAVRLLVDYPPTYVDGVHLAMVFRSLGLMDSLAETAVDLPRLLTRYCRVLLEKNVGAGPQLAEVIFFYFSKMDLIDHFVSFCCDDVVCVKLFGHPGGPTSALKGSLNVDLLSTLEVVARDCNARGSVELAVHVLLVIEEASRQSAPQRSSEMILLAVQVMNPVLSHLSHQVPFNTSDSVLATAKRLGEYLKHQQHQILSSVVESFEALTNLVEFHTHVANRNTDLALRAFYSLNFVPKVTSNADAEIQRAVEQFNLHVNEEVQTAVPGAVKVLGHLLLSEFQQESSSREKRKQLHDLFRLLLKWACRWRTQLSHDVPNYLSSLESQLA